MQPGDIYIPLAEPTRRVRITHIGNAYDGDVTAQDVARPDLAPMSYTPDDLIYDRSFGGRVDRLMYRLERLFCMVGLHYWPKDPGRTVGRVCYICGKER